MSLSPVFLTPVFLTLVSLSADTILLDITLSDTNFSDTSLPDISLPENSFPDTDTSFPILVTKLPFLSYTRLMIYCASRRKEICLNRITYLELKQRKTNLFRKTFYFLSIFLEIHLPNCFPPLTFLEREHFCPPPAGIVYYNKIQFNDP